MKDPIERADVLAAIALGGTVNQLQAKIRAIPRILSAASAEDVRAGAQKLREEIAALEKLCDHDCDNEDCVRCFHYPEILEQKRKQLTALTDGGSNG